MNSENRERPLTPPAPPQHEWPDFEAIDRNLGFSEPGQDKDYEGEPQTPLAMAADALREVIFFILGSSTKDDRGPASVRACGGRFIALAYVLYPDAFEKATAAQVAESIGLTKANFNKHTTAVREKFGSIFKTLNCKSDAGIENYRQLRKNRTTHAGNGILARRDR
jgi:hypothetical protein